MNFFRAESRVKMCRFFDVSGTHSVPIFRASWQFGSQHTLKTGTQLVPETSETFTFWRWCLPEKISLNSVAAKASRLILSVKLTWTLCSWTSVPVNCVLSRAAVLWVLASTSALLFSFNWMNPNYFAHFHILI
jgi:hypothetical protein